jgi:hypothetical protein
MVIILFCYKLSPSPYCLITVCMDGDHSIFSCRDRGLILKPRCLLFSILLGIGPPPLFFFCFYISPCYGIVLVSTYTDTCEVDLY